MRHLFATITAVFITALLAAASVTAAFAEGGDLTINGEGKVKAGDTVHFTLNLSDTTEDIIGMELRLFYDPDYLEFDKSSLTSENFNNLFYNRDIPGKIPMNWTDIGNPVSFAKKGELFSCDFKALKDGDTDISYWITELYGDDMTYLKSYKLTYDLSVNGEPVVTDGVLPITDDQETLDSRQGGFINYVDGMGEENSPNKDDHQVVEGKPHATYQVYENDVIEVTRYEDAGTSGSGVKLLPVIGIATLSVVIIVAVILLIRDRKKKENAAISPESDKNTKSEQ